MPIDLLSLHSTSLPVEADPVTFSTRANALMAYITGTFGPQMVNIAGQINTALNLNNSLLAGVLITPPLAGNGGKYLRANAGGTATEFVTIAPPVLSDLGVSVTAAVLNYMAGVTSGVQAQLNGKAPLTGAGVSGTWAIDITGAAKRLSGTGASWVEDGVVNNVVGQLAWRSDGNNHTIFDGGSGVSPNGGVIDKNNAGVPWNALAENNLPNLMGWNGFNTYGVRVDSARVADGLAGVLGAAQKLFASNNLSNLSRASGTTYQNTNAGTMMVTVVGNNNGAVMYCGATAGSMVQVSRQNATYTAVSCMIPPGWFYRVDYSSLGSWVEGQ